MGGGTGVSIYLQNQLVVSAILGAILTATSILVATPASAQSVNLTGRVVEAEGHENPACRRVALKRDDNGTISYYRIPNTNSENGILAVALTALTSGLRVNLIYDTGVGSGCGPEPRIAFITLIANGS